MELCAWVLPADAGVVRSPLHALAGLGFGTSFPPTPGERDGKGGVGAHGQ
ncbi:hypothetical protein ACFQMH_23105 [Streptomyces viridiviolaceus]|uniref:Uncharacterized protein n=1 Tax=Streptomyces viridiviolaceus TaxID=68282 RepID=A0ABW2E371_9ACTN